MYSLGEIFLSPPLRMTELWNENLLLRQEVADFREEFFLGGRLGRSRGLGRFLAFEGVDAFDDEEYDRGDDEKIQRGLKEVAVADGDLGLGHLAGGIDHGGCNRSLPRTHIDAAHDVADWRHDHVFDQRTDDRAERAADDHADREIDDVAA